MKHEQITPDTLVTRELMNLRYADVYGAIESAAESDLNSGETGDDTFEVWLSGSPDEMTVQEIADAWDEQCNEWNTNTQVYGN